MFLWSLHENILVRKIPTAPRTYIRGICAYLCILYRLTFLEVNIPCTFLSRSNICYACLVFIPYELFLYAAMNKYLLTNVPIRTFACKFMPIIFNDLSPSERFTHICTLAHAQCTVHTTGDGTAPTKGGGHHRLCNLLPCNVQRVNVKISHSKGTRCPGAPSFCRLWCTHLIIYFCARAVTNRHFNHNL